MAMRVVDKLEVIDVHEHEANRSTGSTGAPKFAFERFLHVATVIEARELITNRLCAQRLSQFEIGQRERDVLGNRRGEANPRFRLELRKLVARIRGDGRLTKVQQTERLSLRHHRHAEVRRGQGA